MARLPPGTLMQRAAAGLASVCAGLVGRVYGARVVVLAGSGDNGGDALFAAARLARRGAVVLAVAAAERVHEEGAAALRGAGGRLTEAGDPAVAAAIGAADLVIDGLLGIGGHGGLREPSAALAGLAVRCPAVVVATDLPSGVDADTGVVAGAAVRADVTVTFGTWKPGLLIDPGARHAGVVELIDIGLGPYLGPPDVAGLQAADVAALLPQPSEDSDKYRRGVVGIVAGSDRFTGAATLAVGGALRGGAGMIRLVSAPSAVAVVRERWPETVITVTGGQLAAGEEIGAAGRVQAWVAGPGMGTDDGRGRGWPRCSPPTSPCSWTRTGSRWSRPTRGCWRGPPRRCSPRTPENWAGCSASTRPTWRRTAWSTPGWPLTSWEPRSWSRARPRSSPPQAATQRPGRPW